MKVWSILTCKCWSSNPRRLQRLELLAAKFDAKVSKVESWAAGKDEALVVTEDIDSSNLAEIMVREFQDTSSIRTPTSLGHLIYIPGQLV